MADPMLRLAEKALRAAEAVLQSGIESNDPSLTVAGVRETRAALELVARLKESAAVVEDVEADWAELVERLQGEIRAAATPTCGRCGSRCSECASELLPAPPAAVGPSVPSEPEDAVIVPDVSEGFSGPDGAKRWPKPKPDLSLAPLIVTFSGDGRR